MVYDTYNYSIHGVYKPTFTSRLVAPHRRKTWWFPWATSDFTNLAFFGGGFLAILVGEDGINVVKNPIKPH